MGFNAPSKIQETALPALLADPLVTVSSLCVPYLSSLTGYLCMHKSYTKAQE